MPLLHPGDRITLTGKTETVQAELLAETASRLFLRLSSDAPTGTFRSESSLQCDVMQGSFRGSFHSRIVFSERDLHSGRQVLLLDYPSVFRRERIS